MLYINSQTSTCKGKNEENFNIIGILICRAVFFVKNAASGNGR